MPFSSTSVSQSFNLTFFCQRKTFCVIFITATLQISTPTSAQKSSTIHDSIDFNGLATAYSGISFAKKKDWTTNLCGRFIPTLWYGLIFPKNQQLDFETALNSNASYVYFDSIETNVSIKLYRLWMRYSAPQWEIRAGLQKISFGSAILFRPLMWFDQIDPRDPLKLTNGVTGILGRYYSLKNINAWLWCLYGNKDAKIFDIGKSVQNKPEYGGRIQIPTPLHGEIAASGHFRMVDTIGLSTDKAIEERRFAIDGKWDAGIGIWIEASWTQKAHNLANLTNQEYITFGSDYNFAIGNGLQTTFEHFFASTDEHAFAMKHSQSLSGLSFNYPIGIADNLNTIFFYDWEDNSIATFASWKHFWSNISLYVMGFWNQSNSNLPQQTIYSQTLAGRGIQILITYNF